MPATNTAPTILTKTVTVEASDASGRLSNRQFNDARDHGYWRLRDLTARADVQLRSERGFRLRGDRDFAVDVELVIGHEYELSAGDPRGRGKDAPVSGTFTVLPPTPRCQHCGHSNFQSIRLLSNEDAAIVRHEVQCTACSNTGVLVCSSTEHEDFDELVGKWE